MIPKVIHYCWFGGKEKPKLARKCIESWKKYCSDYEIVEWNEQNFDVNKYEFTKYCYENKKWAFLSDFARLIIIYENGGIYLDTDVELIKSLDDLLEYGAFVGFQDANLIATGLGFGAEKEHLLMKSMIEQYTKRKSDANGEFELIPCPILNTEALVELGLKLNGKRQSIKDIEIFPIEYFSPYDDTIGVMNRTENTYSIHWYSKSWISKPMIIRSKITRVFHRLFGVDCFAKIKQLLKMK